MTPSLRKFVLTAHVSSSVAWIGAVAAFLVLAITGLTTHDLQMMSATYRSMELVARFIIVPLAFASVLTGLIQSLGTPWGLFRHYWIVAKLFLTIFATVVLLQKMRLISYVARRAAETPLPVDALRAAGMPLVVHAAGGILVLLAATTLSVYKPWGLTRFGLRGQQRRRHDSPTLEETLELTVISDLGNGKSANGERGRLRIVLAAGFGILVVTVHISMHLMGHSLHHRH